MKAEKIQKALVVIFHVNHGVTLHLSSISCHRCLLVASDTLLLWRRSRGRGGEEEQTDLMTCAFLARPIGGRGAVLLALIGALYSALLQDYYINCSDLITLGMQGRRMEYVISLQIHTS